MRGPHVMQLRCLLLQMLLQVRELLTALVRGGLRLASLLQLVLQPLKLVLGVLQLLLRLLLLLGRLLLQLLLGGRGALRGGVQLLAELCHGSGGLRLTLRSLGCLQHLLLQRAVVFLHRVRVLRMECALTRRWCTPTQQRHPN